MREFETGATRDNDEGKLDYEGFLSHPVLERFAMYMHQHRIQADGELRSSDNWQKGIPRDAYMKSMFRHFMDVWALHRNPADGDMELALCALLFNVMGYLQQELTDRGQPNVTAPPGTRKCGYLSRTLGSGAIPTLLAPCRYPEGHSGPHEP